jgi:hypothetical protein
LPDEAVHEFSRSRDAKDCRGPGFSAATAYRVEHDERCIAAQFQRRFLHRAGALLHEQLADLGRAGEGEFADGRVRGQLAADFVRRPDDARPDDARIDTLWHAGARIAASRKKASPSPASAPSCAGRKGGPRLAADHRRRNRDAGEHFLAETCICADTHVDHVLRARDRARDLMLTEQHRLGTVLDYR